MLILNRIMIHFLTATLNYIPKVLIITFITQYNRKILPITVSRKSKTKVSKHTCFLVLFIYFFITQQYFYYLSTAADFPVLLYSVFSPFISPQ